MPIGYGIKRTVCPSAWSSRQLLEKREDVAPLQLPANDHLVGSVNAMHLKDRFGDVESDCGDRLQFGSSESWEL
jgi:hypothetical protein